MVGLKEKFDMENWWDDFLDNEKELVIDADTATLIQRALHNHEGQLSEHGALVIRTGKHTGRSPEDKFVVDDEYSSGVVDWSNVRKVDGHTYVNVRNQLTSYISNFDRELYICERSVSSNPRYQLGVRLITTEASSALFAKNLFRDFTPEPAMGSFTILHCPLFEVTQCSSLIKGPTVILINFEEREILIAGTQYLGEIKKAVFSVMNTILPDYGVLPAHAGANSDHEGNVSVFFGLSGTGKTTLSTDIGMHLIGDDEHGFDADGIFNLEGGCYAKTFRLSDVKEPQIFQAVNKFGTVIENVPMDKFHHLDFDSSVYTENGRAAYPLSSLPDAVQNGDEPFPANIFFLSADAMGVLPAVSKLTLEQVYYFFLSGYTSKVSGTEVNLEGVRATFSHCFGAPFMMRRPLEYAELLKDLLADNLTKVWLVNTGWYGGPYGIGQRYDLSTTRKIVRSIQNGQIENCEYNIETVFNLSVPAEISGVDSDILHPRDLWEDKHHYDKVSRRLKVLFTENFKKYDPEIVAENFLARGGL